MEPKGNVKKSRENMAKLESMDGKRRHNDGRTAKRKERLKKMECCCRKTGSIGKIYVAQEGKNILKLESSNEKERTNGRRKRQTENRG